MVPFEKVNGRIQARVNESGSIFAPHFTWHPNRYRCASRARHRIVFPGAKTWHRPHIFLGDNKNELTYIAEGYQAKNLGVQGDVNLSPGTDHTKWELK